MGLVGGELFGEIRQVNLAGSPASAAYRLLAICQPWTVANFVAKAKEEAKYFEDLRDALEPAFKQSAPAVGLFQQLKKGGSPVFPSGLEDYRCRSSAA